MRILVLLCLMSLLTPTPLLAQDADGCADHPVISRYPGSTIAWCTVENYRPYRVPVGPVTGYRTIDAWIDTEGRVTRIYYTLDGGERTDDEVYRNYEEALRAAGFEVLAAGYVPGGTRGNAVGSPGWRAVFFAANPWNTQGPVNEMVTGSSTSGGGGTILARKERAAGTVYVAVSVYRFREDRVSTLIDVVEVEAAETGLVTVDAEAIGAGIQESGRVVLNGILFEFDKATLRPESHPALEQIATYLKSHGDRSFYVVGHTDSRGTLEYNRKLSSDRARAVADALVAEFGIARARLESHGVGPLVPVFSNGSDAGRERNRRVELVER